MRIQNINFNLPKTYTKNISFSNNLSIQDEKIINDAKKHIENVQKQGREIIANTKAIKETIEKISNDPKATIIKKDDPVDSEFHYYTFGTVGLPDKRIILKNPKTGKRQFVDYQKKYNFLVYQDDKNQTYYRMKKGKIIKYIKGSNSEDYNVFAEKTGGQPAEYDFFENGKLKNYQDDKCRIIFKEDGKARFYIIYENKEGYARAKYSTQSLNPNNTYTVIVFRDDAQIVHKNLNLTSYHKLIGPLNF